MKVYASPVEFEGYDYKNYDPKDAQAREERHTAALKAKLKESGYTGANTGKIASFPVADGAAQYMVAESATKTVLIHMPYGDAYHYNHVERLTKKDIFDNVARGDAVAKLFAKRAGWWASQEVGAVVHYSNGGGQYVRGMIVEADGEHKMLPTALVGAWGEFDMPRRHYDGRVHTMGTYARALRGEIENKPMQPHSGNMLGAPEFSGPRGPRADFDPTTAAPLDLSDPVDSPAHAAARKVGDVMDALNAALAAERDGPNGWHAQLPKDCTDETRARAYATWVEQRLAAAQRVLAAA